MKERLVYWGIIISVVFPGIGIIAFLGCIVLAIFGVPIETLGPVIPILACITGVGGIALAISYGCMFSIEMSRLRKEGGK